MLGYQETSQSPYFLVLLPSILASMGLSLSNIVTIFMSLRRNPSSYAIGSLYDVILLILDAD